MTEHTDKAAQKSGRKSGKSPPAKRAGKARPPGGKQAKAPAGKPARAEDAGAGSAAAKDLPVRSEAAQAPATGVLPDKGGAEKMGPEKMGPEKALAPDPATIVFGSNRPIVAAPPKLPAGSGLQFSGSSAGLLKASGPQPTSPKASGLTFSSASKPVASAKPVAPARPAAAKPASVVKDPAGKPTAATAKAPETKPDDGKKPVLTKPAIAPQASGRHFDRERSTGGFLAMLLVLTVAVGGLAFWMKLGGETPPEAEAPAQQVAIAPAAPETTTAPEFAAENAPEPMPGAATEAETAVVFEPSIRAPESPGPLAGGDSAAGGLSTAEIGEVQELLSRLNLDPGSLVGVLTEETAAAIRSYQEMAGLPADGTADHALLEELRSVVELYGG